MSLKTILKDLYPLVERNAKMKGISISAEIRSCVWTCQSIILEKAVEEDKRKIRVIPQLEYLEEINQLLGE